MLGKAQLQQQLVKEAMKTKSEQFAFEEFISRRPTRAASRMWPRGATVRPMRGYQDFLQLHLQLRSARDVPSTPQPVSGGRGRGA